MIKLLGGELKL